MHGQKNIKSCKNYRLIGKSAGRAPVFTDRAPSYYSLVQNLRLFI